MIKTIKHLVKKCKTPNSGLEKQTRIGHPAQHARGPIKTFLQQKNFNFWCNSLAKSVAKTKSDLRARLMSY